MSSSHDPPPLQQLRSLQAEIEHAGRREPVEAMKQYLQRVRELRLREPEKVAKYGAKLLAKHRGSLTEEEVWQLHEQTAIAALDIHAMPLAQSLVTAVKKRFPDSQRAQQLMSMYVEAKGELQQAAELHSSWLEDNDQHAVALKRQVALAKSSGKLPVAVDLLRRYVETYATDREAWEELASLYLQGSMFQQAAFCYEELLLHSPACLPLYVQYADVLYTLGGSNLRTARSYYAAALEMSGGDNVRALYGLTACAAQLSGQKGKAAADEADTGQLAAQTLIRLYSERSPSKVPMVKQLLKQQGLAQ